MLFRSGPEVDGYASLLEATRAGADPMHLASGEERRFLEDGDEVTLTARAARAGIVTGVLLAVARIAGETAPLLFTALSNQFWTMNLLEPMANLPVTIFKFAMSPFVDWQRLAWAGVFLITMGVLALNIVARVLFKEEIKR